MFSISGINSNRFKAFCKEGGKLPSFSVLAKNIDHNFSLNLSKQISLGDYIFYKKELNKYWISFREVYMSLNSDMNEATVYLPKKDNVEFDFEIAYLLMQAYMYRLVNTGNLMIHSAVAVFDNEAILFCGSSGAGKSTQANLWKEYLNAWILNYDKPCIINYNGKSYAHGSPWSGKEGLYKNEFAPLKAIVFVKQAKENRVVKLSTAQAFSNLYLHNYVYPLEKIIEKNYTDVINCIASNISVYELFCDISEEAVEVLYSTLFHNKTYKEVKKEMVKYKVKDCFYMSKIADDYVVIARGAEAVDFSATVVFNESGAFLWENMKKYITIKELTDKLANNYSIEKSIAQDDVQSFIKKMKDNHLIDEME